MQCEAAGVAPVGAAVAAQLPSLSCACGHVEHLLCSFSEGTHAQQGLMVILKERSNRDEYLMSVCVINRIV